MLWDHVSVWPVTVLEELGLFVCMHVCVFVYMREGVVGPRLCLARDCS